MNYKNFEGVDILLISISQNDALVVGIIGVSLLYLFNIILASKGSLREKFNIEDEFMKFIFFCYCALLISKIYFPMNLSSNSVYHMPEVWLKPIWSILELYKSNTLVGFLYQILGNLVLLSPLSFFALYFKKYDYNDLKGVMILCLKATLFIEFSQIGISLAIPGVKRCFEINDIILNTLGGLIGYYTFNFYLRVLAKRKVRI